LKREYPQELDDFLASTEGKSQYRKIIMDVTRKQDEALARKDSRETKRKLLEKENSDLNQAEQPEVKNKQIKARSIKSLDRKEKDLSQGERRSTRKKVRVNRLSEEN